MKKNANERCPLQAECERKCSYEGRELQCDYYELNARGDLVIEDQEEMRREREKKRTREWEEMYSEELEMIGAEDEEDQERPLEVIEGEILFFKAQASASMLEIGRRLIEAKEQLPYGQWQKWLAEKVEFSERSAQRFMRIAEGYKDADTVAVLGTRKALALLAFEEVEREEFLAEKHEVNGEEKTVEEMTSAELDEAIRRRKDAEAELARAKQEKLDAEVRAENFAKEAEKARADADAAKESGKKMAEDMKLLKSELNNQKNIASTALADAEEFSKELEKLRNKPVEVAVQDPTEEQIAAAAAPMVEAAKAESAERIRELERQLAQADPETQAFKMRFVAWQEAYNQMVDALDKIGKTDPEKAEKLKTAVNKAWEGMSL